MKKRSALLVGFVVSLSVLAAMPGALAGGKKLTTSLTGAEEVDPADPNATGFAALRLHSGQRTVCFDISWTDIDGTVTAAHIHDAPAGEPGDVVVPLFSGEFDGTDSVSDCVTGVSRSLVKDIRKNPEDYYVNVHSTIYPAGAIRGQLGD